MSNVESIEFDDARGRLEINLVDRELPGVVVVSGLLTAVATIPVVLVSVAFGLFSRLALGQALAICVLTSLVLFLVFVTFGLFSSFGDRRRHGGSLNQLVVDLPSGVVLLPWQLGGREPRELALDDISALRIKAQELGDHQFIWVVEFVVRERRKPVPGMALTAELPNLFNQFATLFSRRGIPVHLDPVDESGD